MNWGTANPFQLEDPKYGLILSVRSHGKYGVRITDSRMFVNELIGALPGGVAVNHMFVASYFSGLVTTYIKTVISSFMIKERISFLEITTYLRELSAECQKEIAAEFEKYGVEIQNFYIESISPPKDEFEKLRNYKEELSLGNDFYKQRRSFDVLEKLADNSSSGSMANAGIGLGMGLGMAPNMGGIFGNVANNIETEGNSTVNDSATVKCPRCSALVANRSRFCGNCGERISNGIICPSCNHENQEGTKFCGNCGQKLIRKCSHCGAENELNQRFCGNCGNRL